MLQFCFHSHNSILTALVPFCFLGSARPLYARKYTPKKYNEKTHDDDNKRQ